MLLVAFGASCASPAVRAAAPAPVQTPAQAPAQEPVLPPMRAPTPEPGSTVACTATGRTAFNADSVALRFVGAFMNVRVLPIRLSLPSAGAVDAGPVDVASPVPARISARATTEPYIDGTAYQVEVRVAPPVQGWTTAAAGAARNHAAGLCDRLKGLALP